MIGSEIGHYRIIEEIGRGGMGVVYKGMDISLERLVAIKVLSEDLVSDKALMERFHTEAKAQARLSHANIATLHAFEQFGKTWVIVMEYLDGETFEQMIERRGPIPWEEAVPLFKQSLLGIGYAHRTGIIHRDIKPSNIMVARGGIVKVMDFGIAKVMGNQRMTRTGTRMGTLAYMSPEQIQNQPVDVRSDIYSLGVTLYQLLSGHVPFEAESEFKVMSDHITTPPPSPKQFYPYIPDGIVNSDLKALAKSPHERFQSCEEFGAALEKPGSIGAAQPSAPQVIYPPPQTSTQPQVVPPQYSTGPQIAPQVPPQYAPQPRVVPVVLTPPSPTVKTGPASRPAWLFGVIGGAFVIIVLGIILIVVGAQRGWFTSNNGGGGGSGGQSAYGSSSATQENSASSGSSASGGSSASEGGSATESGSGSTADNGGNNGAGNSSENNTEQASTSAAGPVFVPWHILRPGSGSIYDVTFSPDGRMLASADNDSTVKLWSASTGQLVETLAKHSKPVFGVAFNPDGSRLASASIDNELYIWDVPSGDQVLSAPTQFGLWTVAYSKDGRFVAAAGDTTEVDVWNVTTQAFIASLHATGKSISRIDFSPNGDLIVAGGDDGLVRVWNVTSGTKFEDMPGLTGGVATSRFSPGGKYVVSADTKGVIMLWGVESGTQSPLRTFTSDDTSPINDVIFTPDMKYLISAHASHAIHIWDVQSGNLLRSLDGHSDTVNGLSITRDGRILASSSKDGTIRLWQLSSQ